MACQSLPTLEMLSPYQIKLNHTEIHTFLFYTQHTSTDPSSSLMSRTANTLFKMSLKYYCEINLLTNTESLCFLDFLMLSLGN